MFTTFKGKSVRQANIQGNVVVVHNMLAFNDDFILLMVSGLQEGTGKLNAACEEFGMKIRVRKPEVMYVGKVRNQVVCKLNDQVLEQVSEFKYVGTIFFLRMGS